MKNITRLFIIISTFSLSGCVTTQGVYSVDAYDKDGNQLNQIKLVAQGSSIYSTRNALCMSYPKSKIVIRDFKTDAEIKSESPYQCK
ncbi:hypothetical protein LG201_01205 [Methylobacillus gramineus]|uniref:hypothetical protein n=1 Tax=Methylobacillus gramineus TaxID=755169 RepID=UPI001CFFA2CC|nr:hypothetical protein [Methylobacillus gramineus]MCB5183817.1 hypothetical protein [Methylobacillus gramineus]